MSKKKESEFGQGLTYCLALFLSHQNQIGNLEAPIAIPFLNRYRTWFNGASDHLYDLQIPASFPSSLKTRLNQFQKKVLTWGHGFGSSPKPVKKDYEWSIAEAQTLLMKIDKVFGVEVVEATWK